MSGSLELAEVVKTYPKAVCHLNHARRSGRLGLILGSGVSQELNLPQWKKLLDELETKLGYPSGTGNPESYRAEQLSQFFRMRKRKQRSWKSPQEFDAVAATEWRQIIARTLYARYVGADEALDSDAFNAAIRSHSYLPSLAHLAWQVSLVVSHNFDDALERAIDLDAQVEAKPGRRYNSFWKPEPFLRPSMVNIYHPNGYIPLSPGERKSDSIILTEASFADHLANTNTVESHFLVRHLADKTCLIIGHSLADGTLKNALRLHATQRPGHVNYYVHWVDKAKGDLSQDQKSAIREANFETYNLVTIFADSNDIKNLLTAITMDDDELEGMLAYAGVPACYVYYIVGAVSAGKSTVIGHLRDLATVEEWPEPMPTEMNQRSDGLETSKEDRIDAKLESGIWIKNNEVDKIRVGIVVVDRAPLDFMAFPNKDKPSMAKIAESRGPKVLRRLQADNFCRLCNGHVVVVQTDEKILYNRQILRERFQVTDEDAAEEDIKYLAEQQERMVTIYSKGVAGGSVVPTDPCSIAATVKRVARIVHFDSYVPVDMAERLKEISLGGEGNEARS